MKAYKGFDKDLRCRGFQYEVGGEYETDQAKLCKRGFHACKAPLRVWDFYTPSNGNRFCEVEQSGNIESDIDRSGKSVSTKLKVVTEIGIMGLVKAHVEWVLKKIKKSKTGTNTGDYSAATNTGNYSAATNTGNCSAATNTGNLSAATNTGNLSAATNTGNHSAATNTGNYSAATNTGNYSAATNTGNFSAAEVSGKESVAIVTYRNGRARGELGCWLVLTERDDRGHILGMKAFCIDGKKYRANVWYTLKNGKVKKAE